MTIRDRKLEHIQLTEKAQSLESSIDTRFNYEPLLSGHPDKNSKYATEFLGKVMDFPLWISSMTGGTGVAKHINVNLASACKQFNLGMGLGSCRMLLDSDEFFEDFNLRNTGYKGHLWANLGVAQVEELFVRKHENKIIDLVTKLKCDGLILHVNPLQEWFQPEGDHFPTSPIETIDKALSLGLPLIVKEVGQGMGPRSMAELMQRNISGIEFAAFGGTNFSLMEYLRNNHDLSLHTGLTQVGHSALDMVIMTNEIIEDLGKRIKCNNFIISGGVRSYLDGYYLINKSKGNAVFGMASPFLKVADQGEEEIIAFTKSLTEGLAVARSFLTIKE